MVDDSIYINNKRVAYVQDDILYVIGLDGYATAISPVTDREAALEAVRMHHFAGISCD